jgi:hypothetical protein
MTAEQKAAHKRRDALKFFKRQMDDTKWRRIENGGAGTLTRSWIVGVTPAQRDAHLRLAALPKITHWRRVKTVDRSAAAEKARRTIREAGIDTRGAGIELPNSNAVQERVEIARKVARDRRKAELAREKERRRRNSLRDAQREARIAAGLEEPA